MNTFPGFDPSAEIRIGYVEHERTRGRSRQSQCLDTLQIQHRISVPKPEHEYGATWGRILPRGPIGDP
jgi:hypothetical protein